ncbi:MAG: hypothetical protein OXB84_00015 [Halobacteriovoraceae bacterium]|nr:hypothetical protein [Halobacteriovoraceae bacterium]
MKLALLGSGKTGGKVLELTKEDVTVFDSENPPLFSSLEGHDVILSFLPGDAFESLIPLLIETHIPVVIASTGFTWPSSIDEILLERKVPWIYASNFATGMQMAFSLIEKMAQASSMLDGKFAIEETHHANKKDAPSGTALSWKRLLKKAGENIKITSRRQGDVAGIHQMTVKTDYECVTLKHQALDRRAFAKGALLACEKIKHLSPGLHRFHEIYLKEILK